MNSSWLKVRCILLCNAVILFAGSLLPILLGRSEFTITMGIGVFASLVMLVIVFFVQIDFVQAERLLFIDYIKAQRHDFLNYLQVLNGLFQLGKYEGILDYVQEIIEHYRIEASITGLPPKLAQLFLFNISRAKKMGMKLDINIKIPSNSLHASAALTEFFAELFYYIFTKGQENKIENISLEIFSSGTKELIVNTTIVGKELEAKRDSLRALERKAGRLQGEVVLNRKDHTEEIRAMITKPAVDGIFLSWLK